MIGLKSACGWAVALGAACLAAPAAPAQDVPCRLCSGTTEADAPKDPIRLEVRSRLDFDSLVFAGHGEGLVLLGADGAFVPMGGINATGARAMPGSVTVLGEPGRAVRIMLPSTVRLYGERGSLTIDSLSTDLPAFPRIGANGELQFRFGGTLKVQGDLDGSFRGDIDISVDYL